MPLDYQSESGSRADPVRQPVALAGRDVLQLQLEALAVARRLIRRLGAPSHLVEDVHQDLILEVLQRARFYDPTRGTWGQFLNVVLTHRASRLAKALRRDQQALSGGSLDEPVAGGGNSTKGAAIAEDQGLWSRPQHERALAEEAACDIAGLSAGLSDGAAAALHALRDEVNADGNVHPKSTRHRWQRELTIGLLLLGEPVAPMAGAVSR